MIPAPVADREGAWTRRVASPALAVLSVLLHVLAGALLWILPPRTGAIAPHAPAPDERTIDLDIGSLEEAAPEATARAAGSPEAQEETAEAPRHAASASGSGATEARPLAGAVAMESRQTTQDTPESHPAPATEQRAPDARGETGDGPAAGGSIQITVQRPEDIGLGGRNPFLPKSEAAVEQAESKRAVDHALRDPARERDKELGLGPEGPVLTALAEGTARSLAPVKGRAVFVATTNSEGEVVSLDVASDEGGRAGWLDAARIAIASLRGKKLRLPPKTSRAVMRIEVTSAWKLPSGQDPGTDVTLFHIPLSKGEGKDSAKVSILDPVPKFHVDYIEIGGPGGAKIPLVSVQIDLFHTNVDPTNIGASARRVVHTHVIDSQLL
jgi:hypothetical protein